MYAHSMSVFTFSANVVRLDSFWLVDCVCTANVNADISGWKPNAMILCSTLLKKRNEHMHNDNEYEYESCGIKTKCIVTFDVKPKRN